MLCCQCTVTQHHTVILLCIAYREVCTRSGDRLQYKDSGRSCNQNEPTQYVRYSAVGHDYRKKNGIITVPFLDRTSYISGLPVCSAFSCDDYLLFDFMAVSSLVSQGSLMLLSAVAKRQSTDYSP